MNRIRLLGSQLHIGKIALHPRVRPILASLLALRFLQALRKVNRSGQFLLGETRRQGIQIYRLRGSEALLVIWHDQRGLELVHELFMDKCYAPPGELSVLIPESPRIVDFGSNIGGFAVFAKRHWPSSWIVCVEPDPDNLRALRAMRDLNDYGDSMAIIGATTSTTDGPVRIVSSLGTGSRVGVDGDLVDSVDPLSLLANCDFAKIDIEGSEWEILADPRLTDIDIIVMEYHRRFVGDTGALDETNRLLGEAGFTTGHVQPNLWGHGLIWAWKTATQIPK